MKSPDQVRKELSRLYKNKHKEWLLNGGGPFSVNLKTPTEGQALKQPEAVRSWMNEWQSWQGAGQVVWCERRWRTLGSQRLPDKLELKGPYDVAQWIGETLRWEKAQQRYTELIKIWPQLSSSHLARYFDVLADYSEEDFQRLQNMLSWLDANPNSGLYLRQIPVSGLDTKWLEKRKSLVAEFLALIRGEESKEETCFYERCGLHSPPQCIRLRILDAKLRARVGGLEDISAPIEQLAQLELPVKNAFIVENVQTGLAFEGLPSAAVIMGLGYDVEVLGKLPWLANAKCIYWGDVDTHGFAILNRARAHLPGLKSVLMDEETLLAHSELWVKEKSQHSADELPLLTESEQLVYHSLKQNTWGQHVRLEQERIPWEYVWRKT